MPYTNLAFWAPHELASTGGMVTQGSTATYPEHSIWLLHYVADASSLPASGMIRYDEVQEQFVTANTSASHVRG